MRTLLLTTVAIGFAATAPAHAQSPQQYLQGLLSGNPGQDRAMHEAYDRGYEHGRDDQAREDRARFEHRGPPPGPPGYDDRQPGYAPNGNPYGR